MKTNILFSAVAILSACENPDLPEYGVDNKDVSFVVTNQDSWCVTRSLEADGMTMTDLWIFDYVGGALSQTVRQSSQDANFGTPTVNMSFGHHVVYFVASRGKNPSENGSYITWRAPSDTFWNSIDINITDASSKTIPVSLDRISTKLRISLNDAVPVGTTFIEIKPEVWWYGVDYTTGLPVQSSDVIRQISIPSIFIRQEGLSVSCYGMSDSKEWITDLDVTARDSDGNVMGHVSLFSVPFERNRETSASGNLFSENTDFNITLNTQWNDAYDLHW